MTHVVISLRGQLDIQRQALRHDNMDSDDGQVDKWSGGVPGGIPNNTTAALRKKESLHFFSNNQKLYCPSHKNRNIIPEGVLTD
jgi:hypothetical protein